MQELIREIKQHLEAAQAKLWNLKHTVELKPGDNEAVLKVINGVDGMSQKLTSYQQYIEKLPCR